MDFKVGDEVIIYTAEEPGIFTITKVRKHYYYGEDEDGEFWVRKENCRLVSKLERVLK